MRSLCQNKRRMTPQAGFTLLEVIIALAILAVALSSLLIFTANNIAATLSNRMETAAVGLARSKMYDVEAQLLKDGFNEQDQEEDGDFSDDGWANIHWAVKIAKIKLPNQGTLENLGSTQAGQTQEGEAGEGQAGGLFPGMSSGDPLQTSGLGPFLGQVLPVIEKSVRKVTLTITWKSAGENREFIVSCYFTDPSHVQELSALVEGLLSLTGGEGDGGEAGGETGGTGTAGGQGGRKSSSGSSSGTRPSGTNPTTGRGGR